MWIPVQRDWRLNERHYGALQGLNKAQTTFQFGKEQIKLRRRSYDIRPPALGPGAPRCQRLWPDELPSTECLKDTLLRVLPCRDERIAPIISAGKQIIVVTHGSMLARTD